MKLSYLSLILTASVVANEQAPAIRNLAVAAHGAKHMKRPEPTENKIVYDCESCIKQFNDCKTVCRLYEEDQRGLQLISSSLVGP